VLPHRDAASSRFFASSKRTRKSLWPSWTTTRSHGGLELYARRPDKSWSLTDCISFVVMTDRGLTEALTGDHHFEQAGFRALLREG